MGILSTSTEFLIDAKKQGVRFDTTVTLGRQNMFISPVRVGKLFKAAGLWPEGLSDAEFYRGQFGSPYMADGLFKFLGATTLHAMDYSPYQGATIIHDLNAPLDNGLKQTADLVFDGGTLEHVFNFPAAIKGCMEMVKVGGHLMMTTPSNNYGGHGFYQFSPELLYRVLSEANGFEVERMCYCETEPLGGILRGRRFPVAYRSRWYAITDPATIHRRVLLSTGRPVLLFVRARRTAVKPIFATPPLQSDYEQEWTGDSSANPALPAPGAFAQFSPQWARKKDLQLHWLPRLWLLNPLFIWWRLRERSLANRTFYKPTHLP